MGFLGVIGNISRDQISYPDGRTYELLGGAALHVARAAGEAGLRAAPISIIGDDLTWIIDDNRLSVVDFGSVRVSTGRSCAFILRYDEDDNLRSVQCYYGVSTSLTAHALGVVARYDRYHICCRRPLDVPSVLDRLAGTTFSLDFYVPSAASLLVDATPFLSTAACIFTNAAEFELLRDLIDPTRLARVIVSDGPNPVRLLQAGKIVAQISPQTAGRVEVTGAGDVLAGAFLGFQAAGLPDAAALRHAVERAATAVQDPGIPLPAAEDT